MKIVQFTQIFLKRLTSWTAIFCFAGQVVFPSQSAAEIIASSPAMMFPEVGALVNLSDVYQPAMMRGMQIFSENPFRFDFIVDAGDSGLNETTLKDEADRLIRYFYASLTIPEKDLWVNLSPYESDRIVPDSFGVTEMGRDLLAQDYLLKQMTASLMYPEGDTGKKFWERVYQKAYELYGTLDVPLDTFNKVWIVPDEAGIYVEGDKVFVVNSRLKVMLEEDYVAMSQSDNVHMLGDRKAKQEQLKLMKDVVREVMIPQIEREVNEGQNFATLRQVYNAVILSTWFKWNLQESLLGQTYVNQNKVSGIDISDKNAKQNIYDRYLEAFKKGAYDVLKEEYDSSTQRAIPRKYFSGGANLKINNSMMNSAGFTAAWQAFVDGGRPYVVRAGANRINSESKTKPGDPAMLDVVDDGNYRIMIHDFDKNYLDVLKEQKSPVSVKSFELAFLKDFIEAALQYKDSELWKAYRGRRGVFIKSTEKLVTALEENGFYHSSYFDDLINKYFAKDLLSIERDEITGKLEIVRTEIIDVEPNEQTREYVKRYVAEEIVQKFREGKILWPELGLRPIRKFLLKQNLYILPEAVVTVMAYLPAPIFAYFIAYIGYEEWVEAFYRNWWVAPSILLGGGAIGAFLLKRISDWVEARSKDAYEHYNESGLVNRIMRITPQIKRQNKNAYHSAFERMRVNFNQNGNGYSQLVSKLEKIVWHGLRDKERYIRVENDAKSIVHLIEKGRLPISLDAVIILMLKELDDQNPDYLVGLRKLWEKNQKRWAITLNQKRLKRHAVVFLQALTHLERLQNKFKEILLKEASSNLSSYFDESTMNRLIEEFRRHSLTVDKNFIREFAVEIGEDETLTKAQRADILFSRLFIGLYSRLKQIAERYGLPQRVKPAKGYARRLTENAGHTLDFLNEINPERYGLETAHIDFMKKELTQSKEAVEVILEANHAMMTKPQAVERVGGIDMNPAMLKLNEQGDTLHMMKPLTNQLIDKDFIGVVPFIIDIKPMNMATFFMGKSRDKTSDAPQTDPLETAFLKE